MAQWTGSIAANADDGWRRQDSFSTAQGIYAGDHSASFYDYDSYLRFTSVAVPNGQTLDSAYLYITANGTVGAGPYATKVRAEAADNPAAPTTQGDMDGRTLTTAAVDWDVSAGQWVTDTEYQSPDISAVIQEVIDRAGWASGQSIIVFWKDDTGAGYGGDSRLTGYSHNDNPAKAARLELNWSSGTFGKVINLDGQVVRVVS